MAGEKYQDSTESISNGGRLKSYWKAGNRYKMGKIAGAGRRNILIEDLQKKYNLKGFEFGRWLNNGERGDWLNATDISLRELAGIIGSNNLGLNGNIGIAFGARGRSGAKAHYEPTYNMINLTKINGAGSLAHEYGHALDYNFGMYIDQHKEYSSLVGGSSLAKTMQDNIGGQFRFYANIIIDYVKSSESGKRYSKYGDYWSRRNEIFARVFEQWVSYKTQAYNNSYLSKNIKEYTSGAVYLTEKDFKHILPYINKLVKEIADFMNDKKKIILTHPYHSDLKKKSNEQKPKKINKKK